MAIRQYIGARYVPKFSVVNGGVWDNQYSYEALTIVKHGNDYYTSKIPVPVGIDILNEVYWVKTGDYNGAIQSLDTRLTAAEGDIVDLRDDVDRLDVHSVYNVKTYGAVGNGIADDTAAVLAAVAACNATGGIVYFPHGNYKVTSSITFTHDGCSIIGENMHSTYILSYHNSSAIRFNGTSSNILNGCCVRHIGIIDNGTSSARRSGIVFNYVVNSIIDDVITSNYHVGILLNHAGNTFVTRSGVVTDKTSAYGIEVTNSSVSSCIRDCYVGFSGDAALTGVGLFGHDGVADLLVEYIDIGNGGFGVMINASNNGSVIAADIRLHEVVVDNASQACIDVEGITAQGNVLIMGGWLNPVVASGVKCINLTNAMNVTINGVTMQQLSDASPAITGITGSGLKHINISNCNFIHMYSPISIVSLTAGNIEGNFIESYVNTTAPIGIYIGTVSHVNIVNNRIGAYDEAVNIGGGSRLIISLNDADHAFTIAGTITVQLIANNIIGATPTP